MERQTNYIFFSHFKLPNRCIVDECESLDNAKYDQNWVKDIVPGKISESTGRFVPDHCKKYKFDNSTQALNQTEICEPHRFSHEKVSCNRWIFEEGERTIVNDVRVEY